MAEKLLEASEDKINRNIKDSVFCDLFGRPEYLIQLYRSLHPEDTETQEEDLTIVTLSRLFVREIYNDLGFLVGNRLLVLVEAQSSWSENIVVRFLMYLGETYRRYIEKNDLDLYTTKKVEIPKPELYVIYTGDRKEKPETISLRDSFFGGTYSCVEVEAKVIYDSKKGDILNQFITFSKVFDQMRKQYPDDLRKAVQETEIESDILVTGVIVKGQLLHHHLQSAPSKEVQNNPKDQFYPLLLNVGERLHVIADIGHAPHHRHSR